jgi:hypothetical protein
MRNSFKYVSQKRKTEDKTMKSKLFNGRAVIAGLAVMAMTLAPALTGHDTAEAKNNGKHKGWSKQDNWKNGKRKGASKSSTNWRRGDDDDDRRTTTRRTNNYRRTNTRWNTNRNHRWSGNNTWRLVDTNYYSSRSRALSAVRTIQRIGNRATMSWDDNRDQYVVRVYHRR